MSRTPIIVIPFMARLLTSAENELRSRGRLCPPAIPRPPAQYAPGPALDAGRLFSTYRRAGSCSNSRDQRSVKRLYSSSALFRAYPYRCWSRPSSCSDLPAPLLLHLPLQLPPLPLQNVLVHQKL